MRYQNSEKSIREKSIMIHDKQSKERFTAFVCASKLWEKITFVVIGKAANPRNFKEIQRLNLYYFATQQSNQKVDSNTFKLLESRYLFSSAWNDGIKLELASNCFRHCGFFKTNCSEKPTEHNKFEDLSQNGVSVFSE
ncbi:unnamed protein product [Brachionus calyciflorus]|uniref:Uncharacterized protein n=1 Tax=Brachionus calyciflorus TaxID=104777 RepID=A0A814IVE7_9BILA|nr:unnamed protein product [Brachionus calyciflorus]